MEAMDLAIHLTQIGLRYITPTTVTGPKVRFSHTPAEWFLAVVWVRPTTNAYAELVRG